MWERGLSSKPISEQTGLFSLMLAALGPPRYAGKKGGRGTTKKILQDLSQKNKGRDGRDLIVW